MSTTTTRPREVTVKRLFAVSMNRCAFPSCTTPIIEPDSQTVLAEVCHIRASRSGGARHDPAQSDEDRHGFDNLVLMCGRHHKVIDDPINHGIYTVEFLAEIKRRHEEIALASTLDAQPISDAQINGLIRTVRDVVSNTVHMDFRDAVFRVGGEGGGPGGGGGGGGVLTIVGTTRRPEEAQIVVRGGDGRAPGGGGGGCGEIVFVGRPVTQDDLDRGVRVSSFTPVNSYYYTGLINILGGGWGNLEVSEFPADVPICAVAIVELGTLDPETLLQLEVSVRDPHGRDVASHTRDVEMPKEPSLTERAIVACRLQVHVDRGGIWTLRVSSSTLELATYPFVIRAPISSNPGSS